MTPEQIASVVEGIREKVRSRHEKRVAEVPDFELPVLDSLGRARDAALGKSAAIGTVNPRPPGLVNNTIQGLKKAVARALNWFVRDQVDFNRTVIDYMDRNIEVQKEQNYNLLRVARGLAAMEARWIEVDDLAKHWNVWRPAWEQKMTQAEIRFLQALRDVESAARDRDTAFRDSAAKMHQDYQEALQRTVNQVQQKFWEDLSRLKAEQEHQIHTELRLIRRRALAEPAAGAGGGQGVAVPASEGVVPANGGGRQEFPASFDYSRFEERFRGDEAYVRDAQEFYLPYFKNCRRVLDLGCGRGEFLEVLGKAGVGAAGVDADPDAVAACRAKGLEVTQGDLFAYLESQAPGAVDGMFCAHVVEHLPPPRVPELVALAAEKLAPGGLLAIETPNPGCLAIFARDFYLDPTHLRPVPANQLHFYLEEAGFVDLEVRELHPASEVYSEIAALDQVEALREFRRKFFGGLDYVILGRRWKG
jgi:2-polyprenyl-3-methyl-5-hydroxy-6-metoxy-1,4-benzoquinol methylase